MRTSVSADHELEWDPFHAPIPIPLCDPVLIQVPILALQAPEPEPKPEIEPEPRAGTTSNLAPEPDSNSEPDPSLEPVPSLGPGPDHGPDPGLSSELGPGPEPDQKMRGNSFPTINQQANLYFY